MSIKIEVGKYYRDRAGRKHRVLAVDLLGDYPIATAYSWANNMEVLGNFTKDGKYGELDKKHYLDLVAEWQEPITVESWAVVAVRDTREDNRLYSRGYYVSYRNREAAADMLLAKDKPEDWAIVKLTGTLDPNQPEDGE